MKGKWFEVEGSEGYTLVAWDDVKGPETATLSTFELYCNEPKSFQVLEGFCARYSANGYLDCTDWVGPYPTRAEAEEDCKNLYGNDE